MSYYRTSIKQMRQRGQEVTPELLYNVYTGGGRLRKIAYSCGVYGCTGEEFIVEGGALAGTVCYTTDVYAGVDNVRNSPLRRYYEEKHGAGTFEGFLRRDRE